eukprot:GCRY01000411.1.p1 GENE.GCRY01000411.1~~GCRY01000411.1.p1  ORF type:complete len:431 (+),score=102.30 GCRY01000411.1:112-1404(+)
MTFTQGDIKEHIRGVGASPALAINERCVEMREEGKEVFRVGFGESPYPIPDPVVASLQKNSYRNEYLPVQGIAELRETLANWLSTKYQVPNITKDNILVGPGAKILIQQIIQALDANIILPVPCWVTYHPSCKITQTPFCRILTRFEDGWKITPEVLDKYLTENQNGKKNLVVMNFPHNPTGITYNFDELKALSAVFRKHQCIVLSDEIYCSFDLVGIPHSSLGHKDLYPEGTIVLNGMSKGFGAGGWRFAFLSFPNELLFMMPTMKVLASNSFSMTCAPIQCAAITAYTPSKELDEYAKHTCDIFAPLSVKCFNLFNESKAIRVVKPTAGYYIYVDFEPIREKLAAKGLDTGSKVMLKLLEDTGCAMLPGSAFEQDDDQLTARFCFVDFDGKKALEAIKTEAVTDEFLMKYCPGPIKGAQKIVAWAEQF